MIANFGLYLTLSAAVCILGLFLIAKGMSGMILLDKNRDTVNTYKKALSFAMVVPRVITQNVPVYL